MNFRFTCAPLFIIILSFSFLPAQAQDSLRAISQKPNFAGINYELLLFDKQATRPWQLLSFEYTRKSKLTYSLRFNIANRFGLQGFQLEADAYPVISKKTYAYVNAGIAGNTLFPDYRTGLSLFTALPSAFEAEAGFRLLHFNSNVWIYTASVSKYYKKVWLNLSTYVTPQSGQVTQSYFLKARYYFNEKSYTMLTLGTGISPDDKTNNNQLSAINSTRSKRVDFNTKLFLKNYNVLLFGAGIMGQRDELKKNNTQFISSIGYQRNF